MHFSISRFSMIFQAVGNPGNRLKCLLGMTWWLRNRAYGADPKLQPKATQPKGLVAPGCNRGAGTTQTQTKSSIPIITLVHCLEKRNTGTIGLP